MTTSPRAAQPIPAATVVILRPGPAGAEVLLTRRPTTMAFAADVDVFPGGRVDEADSDPAAIRASARAPADAAAALGGNVEPSAAVALHIAAVREAAEEVGIALSTDALVPMAHWTTPVFMPRRFSTWFFVADLPPRAEPAFSSEEVVSHRWVRPVDALDGLAAGARTMWVPTASVLEQLADLGATRADDVAAAITFGSLTPPRVGAETPTGIRIDVSSAGGVPGRSGRVMLFGRSAHIVLDPGDASDAAINAIDTAVERRGGRIAAIVLTRPDPDHAAGAEALAIPHRVPILVAPGAGRHLPYDVVEVGDGELLPTDVELRARLGPAGSGRLDVQLGGNEPSAGE